MPYTSEGELGESRELSDPKITVPCFETGLALLWSVRMTPEDLITVD